MRDKATENDIRSITTSKTQRKQEVHALQVLGEALVALPLDRLRQMNIPESLREALLAAQRISSHGARRRQLQYVGKLMRSVDPGPIRLQLASLQGESAAAVARMHRLEDLRTRLMHDEAVLGTIVEAFPSADLQHLRALRRSALRELQQQKPPRSYRALFQALKALELGEVSPSNVLVLPGDEASEM